MFGKAKDMALAMGIWWWLAWNNDCQL